MSKSGKWQSTELVEADKAVGVAVNQTTGEEHITAYFRIHYSKTGTHIVPVYFEDGD